MKLTFNKLNQTYVWVNDYNESEELSPHYDCEQRAIQWYGKISQDIFDEYGIREKTIDENTLD